MALLFATRFFMRTQKTVESGTIHRLEVDGRTVKFREWAIPLRGLHSEGSTLLCGAASLHLAGISQMSLPAVVQDLARPY
jgi:hypothetical protein